MIILEDLPLEERKKYLEEQSKRQQKKLSALKPLETKTYRYRGEQMIFTKINGVPTSQVQSKTDYTVEHRYYSDKRLIISVSIDDNYVDIFPNQYKEALKMINDLEYLKCQAEAIVHNETGRIKEIANHKEIFDNWLVHKKGLIKKYSFPHLPEAKQAIEDFIDVVEDSIKKEELLKMELGAKMFFFLYFDQYLVNMEEFLPYSQPFVSQLFDGVDLKLNVNQKVEKESSEYLYLIKKGDVERPISKINEIIKVYDNKYKPLVQYKFSEYRVGYSSRTLVNMKDRIIENSECNLYEEVNNNVELSVHYKLRKIE